ncbi:hypothetical protein S40288_04364 [Stachybotrys chartarum IBT 40288]|nr:hypothetical protein S40288_04364 [Stachybotrys chartarum IBT 40288]
MSSTSLPPNKRPRIIARACLLCRTRKTRCDGRQPQCTACANLNKQCEYKFQNPRQRPTFSRIHGLESRLSTIENFVANLYLAEPEERERLLNAAVDAHGVVTVPLDLPSRHQHQPPERDQDHSPVEPASTEDELSISHFISRVGAGTGVLRNFGPSSALHVPAKCSSGSTKSWEQSGPHDRQCDALFANAALQRQLEHKLSETNLIEGVPTNIALHLLNCHWSRQHHTFLLTYRPAIMRDLREVGPHASPFLVNAIFACSSKFSGLVEVRDDPADPTSAGCRFFARCDKLLVQEGLLMKSTISTVAGLLLLGSTYNARGETSKGWLYSGYGLRMVYDLGLHLDPTETTDAPEEIEIRRRVFWGAFICDKLQSLYLGRPVAINVRDSRVSYELFDTYEEMELFMPPASMGAAIISPMPIRSVSTFQQLCLLSKIMTMIINTFYVIGATVSNAQSSLQSVEAALQQWKDNLPAELEFSPWASRQADRQPPNVMILHSLYYTLLILLHRPFISDGHMRAAGFPSRSWERCSEASQCISHIARCFRDAFTLSSAPYILGYTIYVACTIHVRNVASQREDASFLHESLCCLDELCTANPGIAKPASIIRRMMKDNAIETDKGVNQSQIAGLTTPSLDLDAIISMFPASDFQLTGNDTSSVHCPDLSCDPLFGFMDEVS